MIELGECRTRAFDVGRRDREKLTFVATSSRREPGLRSRGSLSLAAAELACVGESGGFAGAYRFLVGVTMKVGRI